MRGERGFSAEVIGSACARGEDRGKMAGCDLNRIKSLGARIFLLYG